MIDFEMISHCIPRFNHDFEIFCRFKSGIHLETKTGSKRERFIVVTRVSSDKDVRNKEEAKQAAELV